MPGTAVPVTIANTGTFNGSAGTSPSAGLAPGSGAGKTASVTAGGSASASAGLAAAPAYAAVNLITGASPPASLAQGSAAGLAATVSTGTLAPLQPATGHALLGAYPGSGNADPTVFESGVLGSTRKLATYMRYYAFSSGAFPQGTDATMMAAGRYGYFSLQNQFGTTYTITWANVASGSNDTQLNAIGAKIASTGYPCFVGYENEPDDGGKIGTGGGFLGTAADYIAAYQHVATKLRASAGSLVAMTYVPYGTGASATACYPGDAYVDWIGGDPYDATLSKGSAYNTYSPMFTWLNSDPLSASGGGGSGGGHGKPLMVGETGVANNQADASIAAWIQGGGSYGTGVPATLSGLSTTWGSQIQLWMWFAGSGTLGNTTIKTDGSQPLTIAAMTNIGGSSWFN